MIEGKAKKKSGIKGGVVSSYGRCGE